MPMAEETKIAGVPLVEYWHADVTDFATLVHAVAIGQVPLAALKADESFLNSKAEEYHAELNYPGVVAVREYGQTALSL